jgi:ABC-type sugar transport system permease subunit
MSRKISPKERVRFLFRGQNAGYLFVAPAVVFLLTFTAYPVIRALIMSFSEVSNKGEIEGFIWFANWTQLINDEIFIEAAVRSLYFAVLGMVGGIIFGVTLAQLINTRWISSRVMNFLRGLAVLPWIFAISIAALMWGLLLHRDGLINSFFLRIGLIEKPIMYIGNPDLALSSLALIFIWRVTPFVMVMILAALKSIPNELYEAAYVDGANWWKAFWRVTMPLIMPVILMLMILSLVWGMGQFDLIKIITEGGPMDTTTTASYYIYRVGFLTVNWSYGSTIAVSIFLINLIFAALYLYLSNRARPWK